MKKSKASTRSVERLSIYRRALLEHQEELGESVFSHEIAHLCQLTAAQVRRDLMLVGYNGNPNRGYDVQRLVSSIARYLDPTLSREVAIVGMGYLGRAIAKFLSGRTPKLHLAAAFDIAPTKVDQAIAGVTCYAVDRMPEIIRDKGIDLGILTVPALAAQEAAMKMVAAGVTGILNFAPIVLHLPASVYVESIDMSVALGKVAFFAPSGGLRRKHNRQIPVSTGKRSQSALGPLLAFGEAMDA